MECELNGRKIKYEEGKLYVWREMSARGMLHNPDWFEAKGCIDIQTGYRAVMINNKSFKYHRVVYFIHNQEWDIHNSCRDNLIDHIDQDKLNNNIENLRVVSHQQNIWNRKTKGFHFHRKSGKYLARITLNTKRMTIGYFNTEDEAHQAYLNAKAIHHHIPQANPL